jgi:hypothetical protein
MCCGSKRSAWRSASSSRVTPVPSSPVTYGASGGSRIAQTPAVSAHSSFGAVMLEYVEVAPIRVWGPATGRPYDFSGDQPVQAMDARDAASLARSGLFRRVES